MEEGRIDPSSLRVASFQFFSRPVFPWSMDGDRSKRELFGLVPIARKTWRAFSTSASSQLLLARDYGVVAPNEWRGLTEETIDTRRMLCGLRSKVLESELSQSISHGKTDDGINGELTTRLSRAACTTVSTST